MTSKLQLLSLVLLISFSSFSQTKKVALTSFSSNRTIGFDKIDSKNKSFLEILSRIPNNSNFELRSLLNSYHDTFINDYAKKMPFEFLPVNDVVLNDEYMAMQPKNAMDEMGVISVDNYKYFRTDIFLKKNKQNLLNFIKDKSDGYMNVSIDFQFVETKTLLVKYVNILATTNITLFNSKGKKVFSINESAKSDKKIIKLGNSPMISPENVISLCDDALQELMKDLVKRVDVITKKVNKKL